MAKFYPQPGESFRGRSVTTLGIPSESQVFLTAFPVIWIGIIIIGNMNTEASYIWGLVGIQFGLLR